MKPSYTLFISIILISFFSNCASVKVYSDKNTKRGKEVPLKVYQSKPYLLEEYNPSKDIKVRTTFIYLPDIANPLYLKQKNGIGSSELEFSIANGQISSFGSTTDSKVPETITAIGGLSSLANLAIGGDTEGGEESVDGTTLSTLNTILLEIISSLGSYKVDASLNRNGVQEKGGGLLLNRLHSAQLLTASLSTNEVAKIRGYLEEAISFVDLINFAQPSNSAETAYNVSFNQYKKQIEAGLTLIQEEEKEPTYYKLFEIYHIKDSETIKFKEVELPQKK